jgi:hypothetical protein
MTTQLSQTIADYIRATNDHNAGAFISLFDDGAVVNDAGREFRGRAAIKTWSDREIFDAQVTLAVIAAVDRGGQAIVTTKVDGNFDRTGLPDPVVINHHIKVVGGKIAELTCRLAGQEPTP